MATRENRLTIRSHYRLCVTSRCRFWGANDRLAAYPDGHAFISKQKLHEVLQAKQKLLVGAGVNGLASAQMCLMLARSAPGCEANADRIYRSGQSGCSRVVDRAKLMKMGMRLGVRASMRTCVKTVIH